MIGGRSSDIINTRGRIIDYYTITDSGFAVIGDTAAAVADGAAVE